MWTENERGYFEEENWGAGTRQSGDGGCETDQTTDVDHRAFQFIKHQVL